MKRLFLIISLSTVASTLCAAQWDPPDLTFSPVVSNNFAVPTAITHAGDGSGRLFVLEQPGRIRSIHGDTALRDPFLDIADRVFVGIGEISEQGLLGIAFAPGFKTNGHFYVDYTRKPDGATVISRFGMTTNQDIADKTSEQVILVIPQPFANHNGGQLAFGPDGFLYIGMGDGGFSDPNNGDPFGNAQNKTSLLGKILRIDVESGVSPYAIPISNPFRTNSAYAPEIWALGLRNPWRFSFDRTTGDLYIGDVGHNRYEEIDFQPANSSGGLNYGWSVLEGTNRYHPPAGFDLTSLTPPISWYPHVPGAGAAPAVIGGYVYRGPSEPRLNGVYIFSDFWASRLWGLKLDGTNWSRLEIAAGSPLFELTTFGEDEVGRIYIGSLLSGRIYRLEDTHLVIAPVISPSGGSFTVERDVTLNTASPGAMLHYTTDGRDPLQTDAAVNPGGTIHLATNCVLKVRGYRSDLLPSVVVSANFAFQVAMPSFSPANGPITNGTLISMSSTTPNAAIHFTVDGTDPDLASEIYAGPVSISGNTLLRAKGFKDGFTESDTAEVYFDWEQAAAPEFWPREGPLTNGSLVSITSGTRTATIRYTTDGTVPDASSLLYTSPLLFQDHLTLTARAFREDLAESDIRTVSYTMINFDKTAVTTLAGGPIPGFSNGFGPFARFSSPQGVCVDRFGIVYVADSGNNVIRKVSPSGEVTTFAGTGTADFADGPSETAQFNHPSGVCIDTLGNLYVADGNFCDRIRKIGTNGLVSTLASLRECLFLPGLWQLEVDPGGNIFAGDWATVRKVSPGGNVTTIAGSGSSGAGGWTAGVGIGIDAHTNIYAPTEQHVWKIAPSGLAEVYAGSSFGFADGPRIDALFESPLDAAVAAAGDIFISDNNRVRRIDTNGFVSTYAGTGLPGYRDGGSFQAQFSGLGALCVDAQGTVYVADAGNHCIRKIWRDGDRDGIPDLLEQGGTPFVVGVDDRYVDSDHDGASNTAEFWAGTDPLDSESHLSVEIDLRSADGTAEIQWPSILGKRYLVRYSDDLETWIDLGDIVFGNGDVMSARDPDTVLSVSRRIYRVFIADL